MSTVVKMKQRPVARPLKVLVPLIQQELAFATKAGFDYYCNAGRLLAEAKAQKTSETWGRWLSKHFEISSNQAARYINLARRVDAGEVKDPGDEHFSLEGALGEKRKRRNAWRAMFKDAAKPDVALLAEERQSREKEIALHREIALQLIDLGYRAMATRLHPDHGGSQEAMSRLNTVRDELKSVAAVRRFI